MTRTRRPTDARVITCSGRVHAERGAPLALDLSSKSRRARVALAEDGAVFCGPCAFELARSGDTGP